MVVVPFLELLFGRAFVDLRRSGSVLGVCAGLSRLLLHVGLERVDRWDDYKISMSAKKAIIRGQQCSSSSSSSSTRARERDEEGSLLMLTKGKCKGQRRNRDAGSSAKNIPELLNIGDGRVLVEQDKARHVEGCCEVRGCTEDKASHQWWLAAGEEQCTIGSVSVSVEGGLVDTHGGTAEEEIPEMDRLLGIDFDLLPRVWVQDQWHNAKQGRANIAKERERGGSQAQASQKLVGAHDW